MEQDNKIQNLTSQVNILLEQAPAGFLPRAYYGLTNGAQVYRFTKNAKLSIDGIAGNEGDAFEFYLSNEIIADYIPAFAIKEENNIFKITNQGDYPELATEFKIVNMRTGESFIKEIENALTLQNASFLGALDANLNKEKQITVLNDLESGNKNVVFASIDLNSDDIYNWISIGAYTNGRDGYSIYSAKTRDNLISILASAKINDIIIFGADVTYDTFSALNGDIFVIDSISPFSATNRGNVRGPQGLKGDKGDKGDAGTDGLTPTIVDGNWFIGSTDTGVKAQGTDGTNGLNGQSFQIQSGLYSTPANVGKPGNTTPESEPLKTLPTLPAQNLTGKGFIVFDPLTTPLDPFYDLYWANNGDTEWTIIHPFQGQDGKNGTNGYTPYIENNNWYINGENTGVAATGPQGPKGDTGLTGPAGPAGNNERITTSCKTVLRTYTRQFVPKTWNKNINRGDDIWTYNGNKYYSDGKTAQYVLNKETGEWEDKTWNGITENFQGTRIWTDGLNIYHTGINITHRLNSETDTWELFQWTGSNVPEDGSYIWTDGVDIYYSDSNKTPEDVNYKLNKDTLEWEDITWNISFNGFTVFNIKDKIYTERGATLYRLNLDSKEWESLGIKNPTPTISIGAYFKDNKGNFCYFNQSNSIGYVLVDIENMIWKPFKIVGLESESSALASSNYIWTDGNNIYYNQLFGGSYRLLFPTWDTIDL